MLNYQRVIILFGIFRHIFVCVGFSFFFWSSSVRLRHFLSHTTLSRTIFHIFHTHNFVTHNLSHLSHTQLCHTQSLTHTIIIFQIQRGTCSHRPSFCVAGVTLLALGWIRWRAWVPLVAGDAGALCVAGVALGDLRAPFAWQEWDLVTSTFSLCGRRGTYFTGISLGCIPRTYMQFLESVLFVWCLTTTDVILEMGMSQLSDGTNPFLQYQVATDFTDNTDCLQANYIDAAKYWVWKRSFPWKLTFYRVHDGLSYFF